MPVQKEPAADLTGHQVRAVEAEGGCLVDDLGDAAFQVHAVHVGCGGQVGGQGAAVRQPAGGGLRCGKVLHQGPDLGAVVEHGHHVTGDEEGPAIVVAHRGQVEEVIVDAGFGALRGSSR